MPDRLPTAVKLEGEWDGYEIIGTGPARERDGNLRIDLSLRNGVVLHQDRATLNTPAGRAAWAEAATAPDRPPAETLTAALLRLSLKVAEVVRDRPQPAPADGPYRATPGGLVHRKPTPSGAVDVPLTNFAATIVADVREDDGVETVRRFEMEASQGERRWRFSIPAAQFASLTWVTDQLGASAIVYAGQGARDHARTAIQLLSGRVPERQVYTATGWRLLGDVPAYLSAGGAIGATGLVEGVEVSLSGPLGYYALPVPPDGEESSRAARASLAIVRVAPDRISVPLLATVYRAALDASDFSLHLAGPTGVFKSELAALAQQHFGAEMDARHLPTGWSSTENALEGLLSQAKDTLTVIDDFAPGGTQIDQQRLHQKADRVLRAQGNNAGRQRMRADGSLRPPRPPRGTALITGEDIPRGESLRARLLIVEVAPGDVDAGKLTRYQHQAAAGVYAAATAGYVRWLAGHHDELRPRLRAAVEALRLVARRSVKHRRTPEIAANLFAGWWAFLSYAVEAGGIAEDEAARLLRRGWAALGEATAAQSQHQGAGEPARRFLDLLNSAIASGKAHVASLSGDEPEDPDRWGWRKYHVSSMEGVRIEWRPLGSCVGWVKDDELYLDRDAALAEVQRLGRDTGDPLAVGGPTLAKRLHEHEYLLSTDTTYGTLYIRKRIAGDARRVLHLSADSLTPRASGEAKDAAKTDKRPAASGTSTVVGSCGGDETDKTDKHPTTKNGATTGQTGPVVGFVGFSQGGNPLPKLVKLLDSSLSDFTGGSPLLKTDKTDKTDKRPAEEVAAAAGPLVADGWEEGEL